MKNNLAQKIQFLRQAKTLRVVLVLVTIILGVSLRFLVMRRGHNFDFDSYKIVGDIVSSGGNVYAETRRYNYGPIWFIILGFFRDISLLFAHPDFIFRLLIVGLLSATDVAIAFILKKKFGLLAFVLFVLNPVSIVITGYHNQFDNLAILFSLLALSIAPPINQKHIDRRLVVTLLLVSASLVTKHIFFLLPLWLFLRYQKLSLKLLMLFVPLLLFALSFVPYWGGGSQGIIQHVLLYKSFANSPLVHALFSGPIIDLINPMFVMVGMLLFAGFITRKLPMVESGLWYLLVLVCFSPAIANQYLAIVMSAVVSLGVMFFLPYIVTATILLWGTESNGLHIQRIVDYLPPGYPAFFVGPEPNGHYRLVILMLFLGMISAAIYRYRQQWYRKLYMWFKKEMKFQISCFGKNVPVRKDSVNIRHTRTS